MKPTPDELARLDAATAAGHVSPAAPSPPGLGAEPTTVAMLMRYRRARLRRA